MEKLPTWQNKERMPVKWLAAKLSPISQAQLQNFQNEWYAAHPNVGKTYEQLFVEYQEFCKAQNDQLKFCVEMEMSPFGTDTRAACGLPPLTWETELCDTSSS